MTLLNLLQHLPWFINLGFGQKRIVFICPLSCFLLDFRDFKGSFFLAKLSHDPVQ